MTIMRLLGFLIVILVAGITLGYITTVISNQMHGHEPSKHAVLPDAFLETTLGDLKEGEETFITCYQMIVDEQHRCWVSTSSVCHSSNEKENISYAIKVRKVNDGFAVTFPYHALYSPHFRWSPTKVLPQHRPVTELIIPSGE